MTKQKELKALVRVRMATHPSESYMVARRHVANAVSLLASGEYTDRVIEMEILPQIPSVLGDTPFWQETGHLYLAYVGRSLEEAGESFTAIRLLEAALEPNRPPKVQHEVMTYLVGNPGTPLRAVLEGWTDPKELGSLRINLALVLKSLKTKGKLNEDAFGAHTDGLIRYEFFPRMSQPDGYWRDAEVAYLATIGRFIEAAGGTPTIDGVMALVVDKARFFEEGRAFMAANPDHPFVRDLQGVIGPRGQFGDGEVLQHVIMSLQTQIGHDRRFGSDR